MVVKVALWYELWTSLLDLCWIIFLFSDLITDEMEEAPNKRNALAIDATPESLMNTPPCPSCPSPWPMELSQISTMASSYAGTEGLMDHTAMSSTIWQPRSSRNYCLASVLLVWLDWGLIRKPPRTSM